MTAPVTPAFADTVQGTWSQPDPNDALSIILKLAGETCNINCYYCYEKRKPYPDAAQITPQTLTTVLEQTRGRPVALELHGGEPLIIGRVRMRGLLDVIKAYPNVIRVSMQTNGTLLDDRWLDLFDTHCPNLQLGVSLDGDPTANSMRVDYRDRPTSERIERALRLLHQRGRNVGVIAVVARRSLGRADSVLDHLAQFPSIKSIKLAPCFDFNVTPKAIPVGNAPSMRPLLQIGNAGGHVGWATTPDEYADFVIAAFDHWRNAGLFRRFLIEPITSIIRTTAGKSSSFCHFTEMKCAYVLTVYPDGRIGTCDELPMPAGQLGWADASEPLQDLIEKGAIFDQIAPLMNKCQSCSHRASCGGGCLATRLRYQGTEWDDAYCDYRKKIIDYVRGELAAQGDRS